MDWIDVEKELPKKRNRFLAICMNGHDDFSWTGIVDVFFDPHIGWSRCEEKDLKSIYVKFYAEHPCPAWPFEEMKNFCDRNVKPLDMDGK